MHSDLAALAGNSSPVGHRTLAEKAFDSLHRAIITGQLQPGARLPIEEIHKAAPTNSVIKDIQTTNLNILKEYHHRMVRVWEDTKKSVNAIFCTGNCETHDVGDPLGAFETTERQGSEP